MRALAIRIANFGPQHPASLTTRFNLSRNLHASGNRIEARDALESMLPRFVEVFGAEHPYASYVLLELAKIDLAEGQLDQALERAHEAVAIRTQAYGHEHKATRAVREVIDEIDQALAAASGDTTASGNTTASGDDG